VTSSFPARLLKAFGRILIAIVVMILITLALNFPYDYDRPLTQQEVEAARNYYSDAYRPAESSAAPSEYETKYLRVAEEAAASMDIEGKVRRFVEEYQLKEKAVLDIGSGRGYLQDLVDNYTGLDISPTVARFYHKKFVLGSATAMPFPDNTFDAIWSIWVFEHVPNPEQAFFEARRVVKDGGLLYLSPAWNVPPWLGAGYSTRPYSDFGMLGKLTKASLTVRDTIAFQAATLLPVRAARAAFTGSVPTTLRYRRVTPNYDTYWGPDSDAVNSIDIHEAALWFMTRGDQCLNCGNSLLTVPIFHQALIIRVRKP
jgi:ubiquinone/menaquinone biosynthesis C-methylase UbiE